MNKVSFLTRPTTPLSRLFLAGSIAILLGAASASAQSPFGVVNGGFETGDLTGWTQSGNPFSTFVSTEFPHTGKYEVHLGPFGSPGILSQNIRTFAGGSYTLTYFLANASGVGGTQFFISQFNGNTVSSIVGTGVQPYTQYTFSGLQATNTSTLLQFIYRQDPSHWFLDDISLVLNDLRNSTFMSLGSVPATLPITNSFTQTSKGTLQINVGGLATSEHDLITVGGNARLDGKLRVVQLNDFKFKHGDKVTFLTAGGKVSGEFSSYDSTFGDTILDPIVVYRKHSVALEVSTFEHFAESFELSPNQHSVARALDSAVFDSRADSLISYLDHRSLSKLPGDFDKIAPEELTSIFAIGTSLATVQSLNVQRRTDAIRSGSSGFSAAGLAINGAGPSYNGSFRTGVAGPNGNEIHDDGKAVKEIKPVVAPEENRWGTFLSGTGEWVSVGNTDNARGYDLTSSGFTLGIDYKVAPNFALGLAAGYTGTTADLTDRGRVWVNGGKIGLYATYFQNEQVSPAPTMSKDSSKDLSKEAPVSYNIAKGFYADVAVFGGYNSYDTRRSALQGEARGDTDGGELNVLFGAGYDFKHGNFTFGPTASFNYTYIGTSDFTEHGSLAPLDIHGGNGESLRTAFGLKASYDWKVGSVLIKPEIRAAWQHEFGDAAYALDSSFANGAGDSFRVNGPQLGRDSVLLGAGFAIQCTDRCATYFYYDGELGRKNYQSTNVTGGIRFAF